MRVSIDVKIHILASESTYYKKQHDKKTDMVYLPKKVYNEPDVRRLDRRNLRLQCCASFLESYESLVCRRRGYVQSIQ